MKLGSKLWAVGLAVAAAAGGSAKEDPALGPGTNIPGVMTGGTGSAVPGVPGGMMVGPMAGSSVAPGAGTGSTVTAGSGPTVMAGAGGSTPPTAGAAGSDMMDPGDDPMDMDPPP